MNKIVLYVVMMLIVVVFLPFIIVRGCSREEEDVPEVITDDLVINVLMHKEGEVRKIALEEYVKGVLAAEMPADFELEALKAQAVAARTYIYGRYIKLYGPADDSHSGADVCTNPAHCLAWNSKDDAMKKWGFFSAGRNWRKISSAVEETEGMIITYEDKVVNALFHSNSGGRTENCEDVWEGVSVPYLRGVESIGEEGSSAYRNSVAMTVKDFIARLKSRYPDIDISSGNIMGDISVLEYTKGGRVKSIQLGSITMKGTEFRALFELKSANFSIEAEDEGGSLLITTTGYGHGVGMSQWGANYLAKIGWNCNEILQHYYTGVDFSNITGLGTEQVFAR